MGQNSSSQMLSAGNYSIINELPNGSIVRQDSSNKLHFLKEYSFTNQQAYQQAFVNFSKKLPEKHQHILFLERTNTKVQNTFCSTFYKIGLVYEYLDHTLQKEIQQRIHERKVFDEKQVWSVLCSCALAVTEMIRLQGRCHAALRTKDIRLTKEGVVKILSLEMVGMDTDHDANEEGTTKMLAITVLNCLLMDHINNDSSEFLYDLVESIECTSEMKNILHMMLSEHTKFVELQEYLFKLVQEQTDSLASYSHTPIMHQKMKQRQTFSNIPETSKQDDVLNNLTRDQEDVIQYIMNEMITQQYQNPDENDMLDDSKSKISDSQMNTLRQKNGQQSQQKSFDDRKSMSSMYNSRKKQNYIQEKNSRVKINEKIGQNSLFTDPKLLNLIHTDLEEIKKRKSVANSRKVTLEEEEKKNISSAFIKKNNDSCQNLTGEFVFEKNKEEVNSQKYNGNIKTQEGLQKSQVQKVSIDKGSRIKNQREVSQYRSNPENQKREVVFQQKKYDNIMQNEEMGFRKNKIPTKSKQEEKVIQNQSFNSFNISERSQNNVNNLYQTNQRLSLNPHFSQHNSVASKADEKNSREYPKRQSNKYYNDPADIKIKMQHYQPKQAMQDKKIQIKLPVKLGQSQVEYKRQSSVPQIQKDNEQLQYVNQTYVRGRYEGTKLNNMRHGKGVFYYNQGGKYMGCWKENKMHGKGVLYYPNNKIAYEGDWKADQLCGYGTLFNEEVCELKGPFDYRDWSEVDEFWVKYQGEFMGDNKQGQGKLYLVNGEIFEGKFKNDMISGQGTLFRKDGSRIKGFWRQNKLLRLF